MKIPFSEHKQAQAYMMPIKNGLALVSYSTTVATLQEGWLHINGLYSATTRKHIGWFMKELGLTYQLAKQLFENREDFNIYTGEVVTNE